MVNTLGIAVLVAGSALGFGGHHAKGRVAVPCDSCVVLNPAVAREIAILQQSPRWRERDNAAHRLAKYDWTCHPEIVNALVVAMLRDCRDDVRAEAAETLGKFRACLPEVHEALARTARCDPDDEPRKEARKALKSLAKSCDGPCGVCGTETIVVDVPVQERILVLPPEGPIYGPDAMPMPETIVVPPDDLPAPLPGESPFGIVPEASRKADDARGRVAAKDREIAAARARDAARRAGLRPVVLGRRPR